MCESIFISTSSLAQIIRAARFSSVRIVAANPNKRNSELSNESFVTTVNSQAREQEQSRSRVGLFCSTQVVGLVIRLYHARSLNSELWLSIGKDIQQNLDDHTWYAQSFFVQSFKCLKTESCQLLPLYKTTTNEGIHAASPTFETSLSSVSKVLPCQI